MWLPLKAVLKPDDDRRVRRQTRNRVRNWPGTAASTVSPLTLLRLVTLSDTVLVEQSTTKSELQQQNSGPGVLTKNVYKEALVFILIQISEKQKKTSQSIDVNIQYCGWPLWTRGNMLGIRPPGLELQGLCLQGGQRHLSHVTILSSFTKPSLACMRTAATCVVLYFSHVRWVPFVFPNAIK